MAEAFKEYVVVVPNCAASANEGYKEYTLVVPFCPGEIPNTFLTICPSTYMELNMTPSGGSGSYTIDGVSTGVLPPGMVLQSILSVPYLVGTCTIPGSYSFTLDLTSNALSVPYPFIIDVRSSIGLDLASIPVIRYGETYLHSLKVLAGGRNQNSFAVAIAAGTLPSGISFVSTVGNPSLVGETQQEGTFEITFSITDLDTGCVLFQDYFFVVNRLYSNISLPCTRAGLPYSVAIPIEGGVSPYRFHIRANYTLPSDLTLDTYTGVLQGSVYTEGVYVIGVRIFDRRNDYIDKDFTLICSKECDSFISNRGGSGLLDSPLDWLPSAQSPSVTIGESYFQLNLKKFLPNIFEV